MKKVFIYIKVKETYPDAILIYANKRECKLYGNDAKIAADILGLILESKGNPKNRSGVFCCRFPIKTMDLQLAKLNRAGKTVAITY